MRSLSVLATATLAFFSTVHAATLVPRVVVPDCAQTCLTPGVIPYGDCAVATNSECLCQSAPYVQAVLNCITSSCSSQSDVDATLVVANALCQALKITTAPAGVTTAAPGQPKTSGAVSAAATTSSAAPAATSKSAASAPIGVNQPLVVLGAAAVAFGVAL